MVGSPRGSVGSVAAFKRIQPLLAYAVAHLDGDLSLAALSHRAGLSAFHLERTFAAAVRESPKQLTLRLRLERAAVRLLSGGDSVLALSCGFLSHEVFCRAFRRRYAMAPRAYRQRGLLGGAGATSRANHAALVSQVEPCMRL